MTSAQHLPLKRDAAIKFIHPRLATQDGMIERLQVEAARTAALSHPGIVEILDFGVTEEHIPYLVMERLVGRSLADFTRRPRLSLKSVVNLGRQICAPAFIHAQPVVHCDLKPCKCGSEGPKGGVKTKLLDFGISRAERDMGIRGQKGQGQTVAGTPNYMAPEQCLGHAVDARTDLYALGCILWELLVGRPVVSARSTLDTMRRQVSDPAPSPDAFRSEIPSALSEVILRALEKEPGRRWPDAGAMGAALKDVRSISILRTDRCLTQGWNITEQPTPCTFRARGVRCLR